MPQLLKSFPRISLDTSLLEFKQLECRVPPGKILITYVWIDEFEDIFKTRNRVIDVIPKDIEDLIVWSCGSRNKQAENEILLRPRQLFHYDCRRKDNHVVVTCDTYKSDDTCGEHSTATPASKPFCVKNFCPKLLRGGRFWKPRLFRYFSAQPKKCRPENDTAVAPAARAGRLSSLSSDVPHLQGKLKENPCKGVLKWLAVCTECGISKNYVESLGEAVGQGIKLKYHKEST